MQRRTIATFLIPSKLQQIAAVSLPDVAIGPGWKRPGFLLRFVVAASDCWSGVIGRVLGFLFARQQLLHGLRGREFAMQNALDDA